MPQLKPMTTNLTINKQKSAKNLLLKQAATKSIRQASLNATKKSAKKVKAERQSQQRDLMEKLLTEITSKYKPHLCKNHEYLQRLEKR